MDAKEFLLKAIRICKDHNCIDCPLEYFPINESECRLDKFNIIYSGNIIRAVDQLITIVENWKEDAE
mgnify:CR=1 FL=1